MAILVPLYLVMAVQGALTCAIIEVVSEKESKMKVTQEIYGLTPLMYWISWAGYFAVVATVCMVLLYSLSAAERRLFTLAAPMVSRSNPALVLYLMALSYMQQLEFAAITTVFFNRTQAASSSASFLSIALMLLAAALQGLLRGVPKILWYLAGLLPTVNVFNGFASLFWNEALYYCDAEGCTKGLVIRSLFASELCPTTYYPAPCPVPITIFSAGESMILMLVDVVLYGLVAWWLEQVWQGEYGQAKPCFFCFDPAFIFSRRSGSERLLQEDGLESGSRVELAMSIRNMRKVFKGGNVAVDGMDLDIRRGEIFALLGHNGAGKTTCMNCVVGLIPMTSGSASVNGYDVHTSIEDVRRQLSVCPQDNPLYDVFTVRQHLQFFASLRGVSEQLQGAKVMEVLVALGIPEKVDELCTSLSGGQKRRLWVATALLGETPLVFLDEPTSGMDPSSRRQLWQLLLKMRSTGRSIIFTTHYLEEADVLADRKAVLARGRVQASGTSRDLKLQFGLGYHLQIAYLPGAPTADEAEDLGELIRKHVSTATQRAAERRSEEQSPVSSDGHVSYTLPFQEEMGAQSSELAMPPVVAQGAPRSLLRIADILGSAVCQSTWQRGSEDALLEPSIQGGTQHDESFDYATMDINKDDDKRGVPQFSGKLDEYRDYRKRALLYFNSLEDSKQNLAAPRLISSLSGAAFECFRERDPAEFRTDRGVAQLLAILDERFQFTPEQELSDKLEDLLFRLRRRRGEESTSFVTRFETALAKVEELITEEQRVERRRQGDLMRSEFRRASLDFIVAQQQHQATVAALPEGAEAPAEPLAPTPPRELPQVQTFRFPEVVKGFIFLRHIGISLQTRASLLRSSGGSLRYDKVADLLRRTELDALVASRSQVTSHGFFADVPEEDDPYEESPFEVDDEYEPEEEFGAYAEGEESEFTEETLEEEEGDGEEYSVAMMGYLEARQKLLAAKVAATEIGVSIETDENTEIGTVAGQQRQREGSQYLGMAITEPRQEFRFVPEFSYVAYHAERSTPSSSSSKPRTTPEFSFVSRQSISQLEHFVEECLTLDRLLGLEPKCPEGSESCCLVTPPGYAILDTGCTSTLVGDENERLWSEELKKQTGGALKPEQGDSDIKFEGINGETKATYRVKYPVKIGPRDGFIQAAVIPGKAPFLLSIQALRAMRAKLDCANDVLEVPGIGKVPLETNAVGHYLLPLLDFSSGHAFASAEAGFGPDSELIVDEAVTRPESVVVNGPPGLDVAGGLGETVTALDPDQSPDIAESEVQHVPRYNAIKGRSDGYAIGALVRLAKETKGPWVDIPKETPTLYLIMGKHAFSADRKPWQVKAAQIGYRAKIFRKPPSHLQGAWVLVMSLVDRCLKVLIDWTECERCAGRSLPPTGDASSKFLFVYAIPPAKDSPTKLCACLLKPDGLQPPQYAHCSPHMIESYGNASGNTYHCSHCRTKCRDCKGRLARVVRATGEIQYAYRKDCAVTPIPGPSTFTVLADGDLVESEGAPEALDKKGTVTYPFNVRKIALHSEKLKALREKDQRASEYALEIATQNQAPVQQEVKSLKTSGVLTGQASTGLPAGYPRAPLPAATAPLSHPRASPSVVPASSSTPPQMESIMSAVREMLATEYAATPQKPDVKMEDEKSIVSHIKELEEQAAELMTRAAYLRQQIGLPAHHFFTGVTQSAPSQGSQGMPKAVASPQWPEAGPSPMGDPDAGDTWEVLRLR
ncbi:ABCA1 [Symbiodinium natans]|uniref:ABCA1 protein n=1 Tax=Symbiodinium natans TaxID=878477 RepID=A0A812I1S3_9DINO|nr:ABCA1 [Symbiodinium natans]